MDRPTTRILIVRFSSLGDLVLLSSLFDALLAQNPNAELWLVTKQQYASLYDQDPRLHRVLGWSKEHDLSALRRDLDDVRFDQILDAHGSLRSLLLSWQLPPAPIRRIRKDALARWWFVRTRTRQRRLRLAQYQRYLELAGDDAADARPRLLPSQAHHDAAEELVDGRQDFLAIAPGAKHDNKRWPTEHFARLAHEFCQQHPQPILVLGGPGEEDVCQQVVGRLPTGIALVGEQSLGELAAVLARARLLISNDSGIMHVAEAVGTPTLALFGPTSREFGFFPHLADSQVIEHALPCRPCSRTGSAPCRMPERWCLTRSTPSLVGSQLEVLWNRLD